MPHTETTVSRRRVLLGTAALALLGGAALITTHGAYAAPPVRTRMLELGGAAP